MSISQTLPQTIFFSAGNLAYGQAEKVHPKLPFFAACIPGSIFYLATRQKSPIPFVSYLTYKYAMDHLEQTSPTPLTRVQKCANGLTMGTTVGIADAYFRHYWTQGLSLFNLKNILKPLRPANPMSAVTMAIAGAFASQAS